MMHTKYYQNRKIIFMQSYYFWKNNQNTCVVWSLKYNRMFLKHLPNDNNTSYELAKQEKQNHFNSKSPVR